MGLHAIIDGKRDVIIGNMMYMEKLGADVKQYIAKLEELQEQANEERNIW